MSNNLAFNPAMGILLLVLLADKKGQNLRDAIKIFKEALVEFVKKKEDGLVSTSKTFFS